MQIIGTVTTSSFTISLKYLAFFKDTLVSW